MRNKIIVSVISLIGLIFALSVFAAPSINGLDYINIGTPSSEANHNLSGWGSIEPSSSGAYWGGILTESSCGLWPVLGCDHAFRTVYAASEPDVNEVIGRMATVTFTLQTKWGAVKQLKIRAFDGTGNSNFDVYVKDIYGKRQRVYSFISATPTNTWRVHDVYLPSTLKYQRPIEVGILATDSNWSGKTAFGQLGIDAIQLLGYSGK